MGVGGGAPNNYVTGQGWLGNIYNNINSLDVLKCPSDGYKRANVATLSYYYSQNLSGGDNGNYWKSTPWKLGQLSNPSCTVVLWECTKTYFDPSIPNELNSKAFSGWHTRGGVPASGALFGITFWSAEWLVGARHLQKTQSNFLAADGHAATLRGLKVSGGQTAGSATYPGGSYTQARGAKACNDGVEMTMSPR